MDRPQPLGQIGSRRGSVLVGVSPTGRAQRGTVTDWQDADLSG
jgi:hypothetical protein